MEKQEKEITINGQKFIAEQLSPNFRGIYDQTCEECALGTHCPGNDPFGYFINCQKVKCIDQDKKDENYNVWTKVQEV